MFNYTCLIIDLILFQVCQRLGRIYTSRVFRNDQTWFGWVVRSVLATLTLILELITKKEGVGEEG